MNPEYSFMNIWTYRDQTHSDMLRYRKGYKRLIDTKQCELCGRDMPKTCHHAHFPYRGLIATIPESLWADWNLLYPLYTCCNCPRHTWHARNTEICAKSKWLRAAAYHPPRKYSLETLCFFSLTTKDTTHWLQFKNNTTR
jgi:hypothetical protein